MAGCLPGSRDQRLLSGMEVLPLGAGMFAKHARICGARGRHAGDLGGRCPAAGGAGTTYRFQAVLAGSLSVLAGREAPTVLTPHAGELGRLLKRESSEIGEHRLAAAAEAASRSGAIVVLKGDDTIVTDGERVAVNAVAAPGLATAGSGDVLSGITAALLARGLEPFAAACAAVLAHARAGQEAARRVGLVESVIATDVIAAIPAGLRSAGPVE